MSIDEEEKEDEEEEDLNDVPLFDNSEEHVEPFHLDESSHIPQPPPPPDGNSLAPQLDSVASEVRKEDLQEEEAIENFFRNGCGCADNCYKHFSEFYIRTRRSDMLELTRNEYDLVIMAQIKTTSHMGGQTVGNKRQEHERQRDTYMNYHEFHYNIELFTCCPGHCIKSVLHSLIYVTLLFKIIQMSLDNPQL